MSVEKMRAPSRVSGSGAPLGWYFLLVDFIHICTFQFYCKYGFETQCKLKLTWGPCRGVPCNLVHLDKIWNFACEFSFHSFYPLSLLPFVTFTLCHFYPLSFLPFVTFTLCHFYPLCFYPLCFYPLCFYPLSFLPFVIFTLCSCIH